MIAVLLVLFLFAGMCWPLFTVLFEGESCEEAKRRRNAALVYRCDQQHAQCLRGDDRGIYGQFPPAV